MLVQRSWHGVRADSYRLIGAVAVVTVEIAIARTSWFGFMRRAFAARIRIQFVVVDPINGCTRFGGRVLI